MIKLSLERYLFFFLLFLNVSCNKDFKDLDYAKNNEISLNGNIAIRNVDFASLQKFCVLSLNYKDGLTNSVHQGIQVKVWKDNSTSANEVLLDGNNSSNEGGIYFDGSKKGTLKKMVELEGDFTIYFTIKPEVTGKTILGKSGLPYNYGLYYQGPISYTAPGSQYTGMAGVPDLINKVTTVTITRDIITGAASIYLNGSFFRDFPLKSNNKAFIFDQIAGESSYLFKGWMQNLVVYKNKHDGKTISLLSKLLSPENKNLKLYLDASMGFESNSNTWYDLSINSNNVSFTKAIDKTDEGIYFDGTEAGTLRKLINLDKDFTLYFTINPETDGRTILAKKFLNYRYAFYYQGSLFYCASSVNNSSIPNAPNIINREKNIAITRNKSTGKAALYVDGIYVTEFSQTNNTLPFQTDQILGADKYFFKGKMKKLLIYDTLHDEQTILQISHRVSIPEDCELYLDSEVGFKNGASIWYDISHNGNDVIFSSPTTKTSDGVYLNGTLSATLKRTMELNDYSIYVTLKPQEVNRSLFGVKNTRLYGIYYDGTDIYSNTNGNYSTIKTNAINKDDVIIIGLTRNTSQSGRNMTLYVNGKQILTFPKNYPEAFSINEIAGQAGYYYKGFIKNLIVFNKAHDSTLVRHMSEQFCPNPVSKYVLIQNNQTAIPFAQDGNALISFNNAVYSLGGWNPVYGWEDEVNNHIYKSTDLINWVPVNVTGEVWKGRHSFGAAVMNNKVYVYGSDYQNSLRNVDYNRDSWSSEDLMSWSKLTDTAPFSGTEKFKKRFLYGSCIHNNELYIIGGQSALMEGYPINSVYKSPDGITWDSVSSFSALGKNISGMVTSYNGKIWVISGGVYQDGSTPNKTYHREVYSSPDGVTWSEENPMPEHITECQYGNTVVYDDKLWLLFGDNFYKGNNLNDIRFMDRRGDWYNVENPYNNHRHATGVTLFKDRIVFVCGNLWRDSWSILKI